VGGGAPLDDPAAAEHDHQLRASADEKAARRRTGHHGLRLGALGRHAHSLAVGAVTATLAGVGGPAVAGLLFVEPVDRPDPPAAPTRFLRRRRGRYPRRHGRGRRDRASAPACPASRNRNQENSAQHEVAHDRELTPTGASQKKHAWHLRYKTGEPAIDSRGRGHGEPSARPASNDRSMEAIVGRPVRAMDISSSTLRMSTTRFTPAAPAAPRP
jgi:hypothetical protein